MKRAFVLTFFLAFFAARAQAYSIKTHEKLSEQVVERSMLWTVPKISIDLGLRPPNSLKPETFPDGKGTDRSILGLVAKGSAFEDDLPMPINHAYDPVDGKGFRLGTFTLGNPSPDWALEDKFETIDFWYRS